MRNAFWTGNHAVLPDFLRHERPPGVVQRHIDAGIAWRATLYWHAPRLMVRIARLERRWRRIRQWVTDWSITRDVYVPPLGARGLFPGDPGFRQELMTYYTDPRFAAQREKESRVVVDARFQRPG